MMSHSRTQMASLELVVFLWAGAPQRYPLRASGEMRIGRDPKTNDIAIIDSSVSRHHAILHVDKKLRLQDLGSSNGTTIFKGEKDMDYNTTERDQQCSGESFTVEPGDRISFGSVMTILRTTQLPTNALAGGGGTWPYPPVVRHPAMQALYTEAHEVAGSSSRACILLLGETGVGKDILARAIHAASPRVKGPFVAVNCPALTESLFEEEMFGHKKGGYTHATTEEKGYFETADGGTLFLDEIGELPLNLQAKLLRVLDDRRISRVGDRQSRPVNVRVIAATNRKLNECVAQGTFRRDLYFRLRGFELEIPPLRSRPGDIIPLAEAFLEDECRALEQAFVPKLSKEVVELLTGYDFPGNVRDLRNAIMHAVAHCRGSMVLPEHLPSELRNDEDLFSMPVQTVPLSETKGLSEKDRIIRALYESGGNHQRAARLLGISPRTLQNWLNRYPDIPRPRKAAKNAHRATMLR